jgi:hypothetical protein
MSKISPKQLEAENAHSEDENPEHTPFSMHSRRSDHNK